MTSQNLFPLEILPLELRRNILSYLDLKSLLAACCVSKSWLRVISPVSDVWFAACKGLGLFLVDGIEWRMCRDLYVRLAQRWRSIIRHCSFVTRYFHGYYDNSITAIYYHNGKFATGYQSGGISLWDCTTESWAWANDDLEAFVTSIKFDDSILFASFSSGSVRSLDIQTGNTIMTYHNPCHFTCTVDYLWKANLVFSSESRLVAWNMSNGRLALAQNLNNFRVMKMLVALYPGEEKSRRIKVLVVCRTTCSLVLWQTESHLDSCGQMHLSARIMSVIRVACPNGSSCSFPFSNELHFDGRLLYYVTHELGSCNGYLNQWDVAERSLADATRFSNPIKKLVGVGKKYLLIIAASGNGVEQMNIVKRQDFNCLTRVQLCRKYDYTSRFEEELFCLGSRSWLDGFDGSNDEGAIFFYAAQPHCVNYFQWNDRRATGYREC